MIQKSDLFYLGKIIKPIGNKGELSIYLDVDKPEEYANLESVFVEINGKPVPFFIDSFYLKQKKTATVSFTDVDAEFAEMMAGSAMYLPIDALPRLKGNKFYYHEILGFTVIDKTHGILGEVNKVLEYPGNHVLEVNCQGKFILIPINDKFILQVDRKKKQLYVEAPEGLIEIYL
jgi:16S rRNA processing protein RimM